MIKLILGLLLLSNTAFAASAKISNAELANMSAATVKGRAAGSGTGAVTDLTATQVTALLNTLVGDSGSGGTAGTCPAPAAGDAAANKFLKADGTWAAITSSWSLTGNSGTTAGTNFVGTTDAQDVVFKRNSSEKGRFTTDGFVAANIYGSTSSSSDLTIGSTSNASKGKIVLSDKTAVNGSSNTTAGLSTKMGSNTGVTSGFTIQSNNGTKDLSMIYRNNQDFFLIENSGSNVYAGYVYATRGLYTGTGNGRFKFETAYGSTDTSLASIDPLAAIGIQNTSATANNYTALVFQGATASSTTAINPNSAIFGVNEVHSSTVATGHMEFYTMNAGTFARALLIGADKTITMDGYGAGIAQFSSAGAISSTSPGTSGNVLTSNGTAWVSSAAPTADNSYELSNVGLAASVSANAMTIALKQKDGSTDPAAGSGAVKIAFRNSTATTGGYASRSVTAALSTVISSGSTAGATNGNANWVYVYAIDNAGTVELAWSGTKLNDEGSLVSTTAEGGAGAADSKTVLYSTTARTNVAVRLIGRVKSTQATAGTWASAPTEVSLSPFENRSFFSEVYLTTGNGHGSTNTNIRRFSTIDTNLGSAITITQSSTNGDSFTINEDGIYSVIYGDSKAAGSSAFGITKNSSQLTTSITSVTASTRIAFSDGFTDGTTNAVFVGRLNAGDVIRAHTDAQPDQTLVRKTFIRITKIGN